MKEKGNLDYVWAIQGTSLARVVVFVAEVAGVLGPVAQAPQDFLSETWGEACRALEHTLNNVGAKSLGKKDPCLSLIADHPNRVQNHSVVQDKKVAKNDSHRTAVHHSSPIHTSSEGDKDLYSRHLHANS